MKNPPTPVTLVASFAALDPRADCKSIPSAKLRTIAQGVHSLNFIIPPRGRSYHCWQLEYQGRKRFISQFVAKRVFLVRYFQ
jgi:hypothetical protein